MLHEYIGALFMSVMFVHLVWNIQKKLDSKPKNELEQWVKQYQQDVPTVWSND